MLTSIPAVQATDVWGRSVPPQAVDMTITVTAGKSYVVNFRRGTDDLTEEHYLSYVVQGNPAHGTLSGEKGISYNNSDTVSYTPDVGYAGSDSFTYTVFDGWLHSAPATVSITVLARGPNQPPTAKSSSQTVSNAGWVEVWPYVSDPDGDPLTIAWTPPAHGTLRAGQGKLLLYRATAGYTGPDSFTFTANDGQASSAPATITLTVGTGGGAAPVAQTVTVFPLSGGFPIVLKATDAEYQTIGYTYSQPAHGTLSDGDAPGKVVYAPASGYVGADAFTFQATDGVGVSAPATVNLVVQANTPPTAHDVTLDVLPGQPISFELPGFDPDFRRHPLASGQLPPVPGPRS